jgi:hypothetical protein
MASTQFIDGLINEYRASARRVEAPRVLNFCSWIVDCERNTFCLLQTCAFEHLIQIIALPPSLIATDPEFFSSRSSTVQL